MKAKQEKKEEAIIKKTHDASEKIATPVSPVGLTAGIKLAAKTHAEVTGEKNRLAKYSNEIAIFLGLIWSTGKIVRFYYPDCNWIAWVRVVDEFMPMAVTIFAIIYRLYPHINIFFSRKKQRPIFR